MSAPHDAHAGGGHEERDVVFGPIVRASIGLAIVLVLTAGAMWLLFTALAARQAAQSAPRSPLAAEAGRALPPEPRLQAQPVQDLQALHAAEDEVLQHYAWVDRAQGVVRIPIERAMELLARRGLPARGADSAAGAGQ